MFSRFYDVRFTKQTDFALTVKKSSGALNKSKGKLQRARNVFKVPNFMKSDAGKSIHKIKEQIKNDKELNLLQLNLERLHKLDRTSCVNKIASNLVRIHIFKIRN